MASLFPRVLGISALLCVMMVSTAVSAANIISLNLRDHASGTPVGENILLDLVMDFDAILQGGGIEATFDSAQLQFLSFVFDSALPDAPPLRCWPGISTPSCNENAPSVLEIGWGALFEPMTGHHVVGTLTFLALSEGSSTISLATSASGIPGPFYDYQGNSFEPTLQDATVQIGTTVPEPASALTLGLGLIALSFRRTRH